MRAQLTYYGAHDTGVLTILHVCNSGEAGSGVHQTMCTERNGTVRERERCTSVCVVRWQIAALTRELGYRDVQDLSRADLVATTPEAAAMTGLPYEPEWRVPAVAAGG